MGILLCEQNFRDVWRRNKSVRAEIGKIVRTHTHTHAAQLVVRVHCSLFFCRMLPVCAHNFSYNFLSYLFLIFG